MMFELSFETFAKRHGDTFLVSRAGVSPIQLELADLRDPKRKLPAHVRQDPFQLKFRGPVAPLRPQGLYTFTSDELGSCQLFLVPAGPEDGSNWYNVVIN